MLQQTNIFFKPNLVTYIKKKKKIAKKKADLTFCHMLQQTNIFFKPNVFTYFITVVIHRAISAATNQDTAEAFQTNRILVRSWEI